jgi:hypothetical protein
MKPCPLCLSKAKVLDRIKNCRIVIECTKCGCNIWQFSYETKKELVARWNNRAIVTKTSSIPKK